MSLHTMFWVQQDTGSWKTWLDNKGKLAPSEKATLNGGHLTFSEQINENDLIFILQLDASLKHSKILRGGGVSLSVS